MLKRLTVSTLLTVVALLGGGGCASITHSSGLTGGDLRPCPGTYTESSWLHCYGTVTVSNGSRYVGEFLYGNMHGQGTATYANGDKYVGGLKQNIRHGQGTFTFADGRVQEGIWENDNFKYAKKSPPPQVKQKPKQVARAPESKPSPPPKSVTFGSGLTGNDLPPCPGTYAKSSWSNCYGTLYAGGAEYVGEFKHGKKHGRGTYTFANKKYVGEFRDGEYHGQGTFTFADGLKYVGEFKDGIYNGQGTFTFADGKKYVGEFMGGKYHGQGTFTLADGSVKEGIFEHGRFKHAQKVSTPE